MARLTFLPADYRKIQRRKNKQNSNKEKKKKVLQKTVYATLWIQWIQKWNIIVPKVGKSVDSAKD